MTKIIDKQRAFVSISEITEKYLPVSKKKARRFVMLYLSPKRIGNSIYVDRTELETLLADRSLEDFPLDI